MRDIPDSNRTQVDFTLPMLPLHHDAPEETVRFELTGQPALPSGLANRCDKPTPPRFQVDRGGRLLLPEKRFVGVNFLDQCRAQGSNLACLATTDLQSACYTSSCSASLRGVVLSTGARTTPRWILELWCGASATDRGPLDPLRSSSLASVSTDVSQVSVLRSNRASRKSSTHVAKG